MKTSNISIIVEGYIYNVSLYTKFSVNILNTTTVNQLVWYREDWCFHCNAWFGLNEALEPLNFEAGINRVYFDIWYYD